ncbi:LOW QUALITY PROTEIN: hypothetical protein HID58_083581 [Brassica napus]|uniref:AAA+ ATPase domain-containing protein n=1 Tax=Brassica napus TaxID=3708 RepID=A0ABQ7YGV5_BRANA|nr:LOW QUALITY PROTEIN: hypothetical protein HID58_083581 [Brassica napus]
MTYDGYRQLVYSRSLSFKRYKINGTISLNPLRTFNMVEENEMNMSKPTSPFEPDKSHMEKHVCLGSSFVILTLSYPRLVHFGCLISEVAWGSYVHNLPQNLASLEKAMGTLTAKRDDVQGRVDREEFTGHRRRLAQVQVWLTSILTMENQYNELLNTRDVELQRLCLCRFCSKNVKKSYLYGKRVMVMLREVESLIRQQREFDEVTDATPIAEGEELPIQPTIGQETMLEMVWNRLMEDEVGIVGLYGMGGVGKTTLLTQINNRFSKRGGGFDVVIWVVVSQNATVHKIQGSIGEKLGLLGKEWDEKSEMKRGQDIHNVLRKKKFVLLLDDIWEKVNLSTIGVPYPSKVNGSKVAFTTRSRDVCGRMEVDDPIEVRCLDTDKAWDLFKKKVGENTLGSHPGIPELAREVAGKCRGLPLALNVIGGTMASKRSLQEWRLAVDVLTSSAREFSGVEDEILQILKYSYDSLDGEMTKSCFLYCSLFPEDDIIDKEELIEYWIGEGFIDEKEGREMAMNKGYEILETLSPECPQLTTLLLQRNNKLVEISDGFFQSMPKLLVLDLSLNRLSGFRMDVSNLGTSSLESLEGISGLSSLRTLKLLHSKVRLDMSLMKELQLLQHIEYISVSISSCTLVGEKLFDDPRMGRCIQHVCIIELILERVKVIVLPALDGLRDISIYGCEMLEEIKIEKTPWNKSLTSPCFSNLTTVQIRYCNGLKDLTWLLFAPNLTLLDVHMSRRLEEIISKEKAESVLENNIIPFQKLEELSLMMLPQLKSIYWNALPFQRLRWLHIRKGCPKLRKLPLNSESVVNVEKLVIGCDDKEWLERVEWEDEATRLRFLPSCVSVQLQAPCDQVLNHLGSCFCSKLKYIQNLRKNLVDLETAMEDLKAVRSDLLRKVHAAEEGGGLQRLHQIKVWLERVESIESKFNGLYNSRDVELKRLCFNGAGPKNLRLSYLYGKRVFKMLNMVKDLKSKGFFEEVASPAARAVGEERPLTPTVVGQETVLEKAWNHLMDDETKIMGLYGMGGVGKTTLLTQINNKFVDMCDTHDGVVIVIWVVVSGDLQVHKIQHRIGNKIGYKGVEWKKKKENQKALDIFNFLSKKRFVLLLDDIWKKVDLTEIGIPNPTSQNGCKIVFTTRSLGVCTSMGVHEPMEVRCLSTNDAKVAGACRGLPLALNVIGETMSCKKTTQEWYHAVDVLKTYAADFSDVKEKILPILKYSYDNLEGENVKSCFLYCSLFPEDALIDKERVIDYWICEGFIDGSNIVRLPVGLQKLKRLMHLNLESMLCLEGVSGISNLSSLKTLKLLNFIMWPTMSLLKELERLEHLEVLTVEITSSSVLKQLLCSHRLVRCLQKLSIKYIEEESVRVLSLPSIQDLRERNTMLTSPCLPHLSKVLIAGCNGLKDLTWLLFAPNLTHLSVWNSSQLEEIISQEEAAGIDIVPFRKLEYLHLWDLPELMSIYWSPLPFPYLSLINVQNDCQKLRKLPLDSQSCVAGEELVIEYGDEEWKEKVEWGDEATRLRFLPSCKLVLYDRKLPNVLYVTPPLIFMLPLFHFVLFHSSSFVLFFPFFYHTALLLSLGSSGRLILDLDAIGESSLSVSLHQWELHSHPLRESSIAAEDDVQRRVYMTLQKALSSPECPERVEKASIGFSKCLHNQLASKDHEDNA